MTLRTVELPQNPIFIVGYPRSGTTLVQRVLITQPGLFTIPETHYFNVVENVIAWEAEKREQVPAASLPVIFGTLREKTGLCFTSDESAWLTERAKLGELASKQLFEFVVGCLLVERYPEIQNTDPFRWIEKTPNHAHYLPRIIHFYPGVLVLHVLRHPVPSIFSRKLKFTFNFDLPYTELAQRWNQMIDDVERFRATYPRQILTLRYEDLFGSFEREVSRLAEFLAIPFDDQPRTRLAEQPGSTPPQFILPTETWKIADYERDLTNSNDRYRSIARIEDIKAIESIVGPKMKSYGYEPFGDG